jgi:hypothetical protein
MKSFALIIFFSSLTTRLSRRSSAKVDHKFAYGLSRRASAHVTGRRDTRPLPRVRAYA